MKVKKRSFPVAQKHYATMAQQAKTQQTRRANFRLYKGAGGKQTMKTLTGHAYK